MARSLTIRDKVTTMRAINRLLLASLLVVAPAGVFAADDAPLPSPT